MKKRKAVLCILLSLFLLLQSSLGLVASAASLADYEILSPYADVVWEGENAWGAYKGSLHSHSIPSGL